MTRDEIRIGAWVSVRAVSEATYGEGEARDHRTIERQPLVAPARGQIVGVAFRQEGVRIRSRGYGDDYEPTVLGVDRCVLVVKVALSLVERPIEARPEDVDAAPGRGRLPWRSGWGLVRIASERASAEAGR